MKLSKKLREEIIELAIGKTFAKADAAIQKKIRAFAQKVADSKYTGKEKQWIDQAPRGALFTWGSVRLDIDGKRLPSDPTGEQKDYGSIPLTTPVRVFNIDNHGSTVPIKKDHRMHGEAVKLYSDVQEHHAKRQQARETITQAVNACTTAKQLEEHYPDLVKFVPEVERACKSLVVTADAVRDALSA